MRFVLPAAALMFVAAQAAAQTTTPVTATPLAPAATAPAAAAPAAPAPAATPAPAVTPKKKVAHQTLQQRFDLANTTHDGHLTKDQAVAAKWGYVANNFARIDKDHRGYVTVAEIQSFAKARRAARAAKTAAPAN